MPDDLELAAMAALHHWHANSRHFHKPEPAYLRLLRAALEKRECMPYQLARRGMNSEALIADAERG